MTPPTVRWPTWWYLRFWPLCPVYWQVKAQLLKIWLNCWTHWNHSYVRILLVRVSRESHSMLVYKVVWS